MFENGMFGNKPCAEDLAAISPPGSLYSLWKIPYFRGKMDVMNELEKMRGGLLADMRAEELQQSFMHCKKLLARLRNMTIYDEDYRTLLEELVPGIPSTSIIIPPFYCDHGHGIRLGEQVFVNAGCTFLDGAYITIGDYTLIGPDVRIYTPHHPMDYRERRSPLEYACPVTIGRDCWIGGGTVICPGVRIGDRVVIGAGSVVVHDIPEDCVAVGNPAVVKKRLRSPEQADPSGSPE